MFSQRFMFHLLPTIVNVFVTYDVFVVEKLIVPFETYQYVKHVLIFATK